MTQPATLQRGGAVPRFEVRTLRGDVVRYATIWQRHNLLLVIVPGATADTPYVAALLARSAALRPRETEWVISGEDLPDLAGPAVLIADRWGEIVHVATAARADDLPTADDLIEWLDYLDRRCPECEGEAL